MRQFKVQKTAIPLPPTVCMCVRRHVTAALNGCRCALSLFGLTDRRGKAALPLLLMYVNSVESCESHCTRGKQPSGKLLTTRMQPVMFLIRSPSCADADGQYRDVVDLKKNKTHSPGVVCMNI